MKKLKSVKRIVCMLLLLLFLTNAEIAFAQEGAEIQTKGEITLVDDSSVAQDSSSSHSVETPTIKSKGRLPSTGELIKYGTITGGSILLILVCIFFINQKIRNKK